MSKEELKPIDVSKYTVTESGNVIKSEEKETTKEGSLWQPLEEKLSIGEMHEYSHKLFEVFEKLEFRTTFNKAIQAFYLEEGLYVVRSESMGKYQYTLVEASSEEMAIRKCM